ncbi:lytic transglycosylase [Streptomyces sp. N35]|uniref:lytic transglycosylase n=1 Tax=Streptomyces sp. N35 TaxID=2795730 RepID=UPI0018F4A6CB|nr:lytic transglycosylase [Streptomyces sp. N35]
MPHDRARLFRACRHTACALALAVTLTTAASAVITPAADAKGSVPDETSAQAQPHGEYRTELPPLNGHPGTTRRARDPNPGAAGDKGIPAVALEAYQSAAEILATTDPNCDLDWELLAGIGHVESGHGAGYGLKGDGTTEKPILGPRLDGDQFALIRDSDGGQYDGDPEYDRAVGPLQFIPSTWKQWGADGDADGERDPGDIHDAALATGLYLCAGDRDLHDQGDLDNAILSYNNSRAYVNTVLAWMRYYQQHAPAPAGGGDEPGPEASPAPETDRPAAKPTDPPRTLPHAPSEPSRPTTMPRPIAKPKPSPTPSKPAPAEPQPVSELARVGPEQLTAPAGHAFAIRPQTRVLRADGTPAADIKVRYEIRGTTDARFTDGGRTVTVTSDGRGTATAPVVNAGAKTGSFTVRAVLVEHPDIEIAFRATVTAPAADCLTYVDELPLESATGELLAAAIEFRASYIGMPMEGVELTASVLTWHGEPRDDGPYFMDDAGQPVRTVLLSPTSGEGLATLADLFAGDTAGSYLLRLTAPGGASVDVPLTVQPTPNTPSA